MWGSGRIAVHYLETIPKAIFGPDRHIAPIPMLSYSFHHFDANDSQVMWLAREEVIVSVYTN